ncbi:MAG: hypothetical protein LBG95_00400 [Treponema sp.]|jgi:hypothetical protein|nr:hypothetical protein [Treponema sp.]
MKEEGWSERRVEPKIRGGILQAFCRYRVTLTLEERGFLQSLVKKGNTV